MELLAIAFWIIGGIGAAPAFCFFLKKVVQPRRRLALGLFCVALLGLGLFAVDLCLVATLGVTRSRTAVGPAFEPIHSLVTLLSAAFLASVLLLGPQKKKPTWHITAIGCWALGVFAIFYQYSVMEAIDRGRDAEHRAARAEAS